MKVCIVHNEYGKFSGEEAVVSLIESVLSRHGHCVHRFTRTSADIPKMVLGHVRAFFSGIYSPSSRRQFEHHLANTRPDIVHVHNVFPLISPSVLPAAHAARVPVVMTLHNYRLICPNALLLRHGHTCRDCLGGREWHCVLNNCERSPARSLGYALRTANARKRRFFLDNVNTFICLTRFQQDIFLQEHFPQDRCVIVPNATSTPADGEPVTESGNYVLYMGRVTPGRDMASLLAAARQCPDIPVKIAGSFWRMPNLPASAPPNVEFLGEIDHAQVGPLYQQSRFTVFPTLFYEGLPTVLLEAMARGKAALCTRIGGLPEVVDDGITGLLFEPGNPADLAAKMDLLWNDPDRTAAMGRASLGKFRKEYSETAFYDRIMQVYQKAIDEGPRKAP